ncbi:MAG: DUF975 family protein [Eubacterium sp.]|nr:DUF975 family protein [Eubacterium sp.]
MKRASDFREIARNALSGRWAPAVGATFVASLLGAEIPMSGGGGFSLNYVFSNNDENVDRIIDSMPSSVLIGILAVIAGVVAVFAVVGLVQFIVGGFVSLGLMQYNLDLIDGKEVTFGQIFSKSSLLGKALWLRLRTAIFTMLWSLLFIIPGIIKAYSYSMSGFIMAENPEMSAKEAMTVSIDMMKGNKWRLFCMEISFIGWGLLSVLTLGIGYLWLSPYMNAAYAAFYDDVSRNEF